MAPLRDRLYSIQPSGNALMRGAAPDIRAGLGSLALLPDEMLLALLALLPPRDLARAGASSRALLAFVDGSADLWRAHVLQDVVEEPKRRLRWRGGWRETYAASVAPQEQEEEEEKEEEGQAQAQAAAAAALPARKRPRLAPRAPPRPPPKNAAAAAAATAAPVPVLYSDLLHASRRCASLRRLPRRWLERETVDRVDGAELTREAFAERYGRPNLPVIVTGVVTAWPAFGGGGSGAQGKAAAVRRGSEGEEEEHQQQSAEAAATAAAVAAEVGQRPPKPPPPQTAAWTSLRALLERTPLGLSRAPVIVGNQAWDLEQYVAYARDNDDEMPLYLFDKRFAAKAPEMAAQYSPPDAIFGDDLFALLPRGSRPDWRWLIAGPARSGSTFHVDPNATSAWNAVVSGAKRWVLFPPGGAPPPGVHPSPDGAEVAAPVSILEWYWAFYEAAREEEEEGGGGGSGGKGSEGEEEDDGDEEEEEEGEEEQKDGAARAPAPARLASRRRLERAGRGRRRAPARRMFECTVRAGELLFVPRGWWHMALNLEEGVAVTHNFVSEETLPHVLRFLRNAAEAARLEEEEEEEERGRRQRAAGEGAVGAVGAASDGKRHASLAQDLVSGLDLGERARLHDRFVAALRAARPEALARAQARLREEDAAAEGRRRLAAAFRPVAAAAAAAGAAAGDGNGGGNGVGNGNGNGNGNSNGNGNGNGNFNGNGNGNGSSAGAFAFSFF